MANTPGVSPKTLSEMAGHSKVAFTLQVYTHSSLDDKKAAIKALEAAQAQ
jgi:integrase